jgi:hypothetical protein
MQIKDLFERDIFRPINGVVKADQLDDSSVWQELDEFVMTRELGLHFSKFVSWYLEAIDIGKASDAGGKMGVWISGFFGSGKSPWRSKRRRGLRSASSVHSTRKAKMSPSDCLAGSARPSQSTGSVSVRRRWWLRLSNAMAAMASLRII